MQNVYVIEGKNIVDLKSLFKEFARAVKSPDGYFGRCLQSFDDCLFGGFGLEAPCKIVWKYSNVSRRNLNCEMLKKYYEGILETGKFATEEGKQYIIEIIESAKKGEKSMFDEIIDFIGTVTERGSDDWIVELVLE